jgi:hypothetical protein
MTAHTYAHVTREVERVIRQSSENDKDRVAYMVARAALLSMADRRRATETAFNLADELAGVLPP